MAQNNDNDIDILLKENVFCAIKVIRENKKRPDCQSICDYINKFTDSKTSVDYLHLVIQSLLDNSKIFNKPTKKGLPSYYISNEEPEDTPDKESEADSINETPIISDHLFTPKSKDINKDLIPKESSNEKIHENETIETLKNSILNMNAELMALKSFVMDELYGLNKNIDRVRIEQCDQTNFMEGMKKILEEIKTKTEIIKTLSDNVIIITTYYRNISEIKKSQHTDKLDFYEKRTTNDGAKC